MSHPVPGMVRIQEGNDIRYVRHNLRRGLFLCGCGAILVLFSSLSLLHPGRGLWMWSLAGLLFLIGSALLVIGGLALRERVSFRISRTDDEVELLVRSGSERAYRTRRSQANRVVLEFAGNVPRTASDAWSVRISGFGETLVLIARGSERPMKFLARQLATDLGADLSEPRGFTSRHD